MRIALVTVTALLLTACLGMPAGVRPVDDFDLQRYLGRWYEIARLDHSFERGLERVTADYSLREDGGISVTNRGWSPDGSEWREALGRAYFAGSDKLAYLKVSFFGPFYGSYVVFELGEDYDYAFVAGNSTDYLWLLARTPQLDPAIVDRFIARAGELGFPVQDLIMVNQADAD